MTRLLLIDDNPDDRLLARRELIREFVTLQVRELSDVSGLVDVLKKESFDLVITDYRLSCGNGLEVVHTLKSSDPECPVIMFTNTGSEEIAVEAMKSGVDDYIIKSPKNYRRLAMATRSILERVEAQRKVIRLEMRLQGLLERLNVGVFRATLDGHLLEGNSAFLRLLGVNSLPEAEALDLQPFYLQSPEEMERQMQLRRSNGEPIWVAINKTISTTEGETVIDALIEDITERKQYEAKLAQMLEREQAARAEAEMANRIKDEFLMTLSHELRTPLNSMLGWSRMLRSGKLDPKTATRAIETLDRNAQLLTQLVEDLLDVSRIITGKLRLELHPMDLQPAIAAAIDTAGPTAEAKSIQLDYIFSPSVGLVLGDADRLQQIVWNLLSNAIKFTPKGGRVEVRLERIDSEVEIRVSDTGIGMSADFLPYVFERFTQADSSTTRSHGGLGLGLAIVRHLVELHGGTISAESAGEGKGTTFRVRLPLLASE